MPNLTSALKGLQKPSQGSDKPKKVQKINLAAPKKVK